MSLEEEFLRGFEILLIEGGRKIKLFIFSKTKKNNLILKFQKKF